jgi:hypothetical protein
VNKKDNKKYAPYFPELVDFQSKLSIYKIVFADLWLANGTVQKNTSRKSSCYYQKHFQGRGWNFKKMSL